MPAARIDVLVPAFNVAATVERSLRSILDQSVRDIRIVVVDDGSTDETRAILARMRAEDPRLEIVDVPHGGIVDALNAGLAHCTAVGANAFHIDGAGRRVGSWTTFDGDVMPNARLLPSQEPYLMHPFLMVRRASMMAVGGIAMPSTPRTRTFTGACCRTGGCTTCRSCSANIACTRAASRAPRR